MDQGLFQQLLASNNEDCLSNPVICTDSDYSPVVQDFASQPFFYNAKHIDAVSQEIFRQMYESTSTFETVEMLSTVISLEQSLHSPQHQQPNVDRTLYPSFASHDVIPIAAFPAVPTTFISHKTISDDEPDHDFSFGSITFPINDGAKRRKDRRRAQNRSAQRAFRARKEEAIKESAVKVKELQDNLACLQSANAGLLETVGHLKAQVLRLQAEKVLEQWRLSPVSSLNGEPCIAPQKRRLGLD